MKRPRGQAGGARPEAARGAQPVEAQRRQASTERVRTAGEALAPQE